MAMATSAGQALLLMALATAALMSTASGTLQYDFYRSSCPKAEEAVRNATMNIIAGNPTMGAAFVRLFFHDCFVRVRFATVLSASSILFYVFDFF
jgi:peroxidase